MQTSIRLSLREAAPGSGRLDRQQLARRPEALPPGIGGRATASRLVHTAASESRQGRATFTTAALAQSGLQGANRRSFVCTQIAQARGHARHTPNLGPAGPQGYRPPVIRSYSCRC
jgi:hypothetical protein